MFFHISLFYYMAKTIGITGGIGSGKTTVCKIFEVLGVPIFYSDDEAKFIIENNEFVIQKIKNLFGNEAYFENGKYNKSFVASKIFHDKSLLLQLNSIVHPIVIDANQLWNKRNSHYPYIINESALIFETGKYKNFDKTILIYSPEELRIKRVMIRDDISRDNVLARIKNQMSDLEKIKFADRVIINNYGISLLRQIFKIHRDFMK